MKKNKIFIFTLLLLGSLAGYGQVLKKQLTLEEVINLAHEQSPDALSAKNRFLKAFWEMRTSDALLLPKLSLDATIPNFSRSIVKVTQPDGTDAFREVSQANTTGALSLSKNVGLTGGSVFLSSSLQRIDYLSDSTTPTAWLSSPLVIGYSQNIFTFNPYKWSKKIDPIKYNEAKRSYLEDVEQVAITTTNYFFNLLISQIRQKIQEQNVANYDTLYKIGVGRFNLGKIPENDLLQLELSLLQAQAAVESNQIELEDRMFKLKSYLRLQDDTPIELIPPVDEIRFFDVAVDEATTLAQRNSSTALSFDRRLLEADREVNRAQTTDRFSARLFAQYGLTQSANQFGEVYQSPQNQQQVSLGLSIPILDWGLAKGRIKMAESDREIVRTAVEQEQIDFDQSVYLQVQNFRMQQRQLAIAAKADTVAQKGFDISKQRYLIGNVDIINLRDSQTSSDNARLNFIRSLQTYWVNYYQLRKLTLFDFKKKEEITIDFDKLR
ncbi:MAG: TolC family protein [Bacteroidales bacterium]|nr:TolC family protein [Bacteroidales bacterium]